MIVSSLSKWNFFLFGDALQMDMELFCNNLLKNLILWPSRYVVMTIITLLVFFMRYFRDSCWKRNFSVRVMLCGHFILSASVIR